MRSTANWRGVPINFARLPRPVVFLPADACDDFIRVTNGPIRMRSNRARLATIITFPGVVVHEWAHRKFCDWLGIKVYEVIYIDFRALFAARSSTLGYVVHAVPEKFSHTILISTGPLFINSILAIAFGYVAAQIARSFLAQLTFYWVAISIGVHAFPSNQDARNILQRAQTDITNIGCILHYLSYSFYGFICVANHLRRWGLHFVYAAMLVTIGSRS